jgi:hypothetical protein
VFRGVFSFRATEWEPRLDGGLTWLLKAIICQYRLAKKVEGFGANASRGGGYTGGVRGERMLFVSIDTNVAWLNGWEAWVDAEAMSLIFATLLRG